MPPQLADLRAAHTGQAIPSTGKYAGRNLGDNVARGYMTVDIVDSCCADLAESTRATSWAASHTPGTGFSGEYIVVDLSRELHEVRNSCSHRSERPLCSVNATFYGRLASAPGGADKREPLPSTWALGALTDSSGQPGHRGDRLAGSGPRRARSALCQPLAVAGAVPDARVWTQRRSTTSPG